MLRISEDFQSDLGVFQGHTPGQQPVALKNDPKFRAKVVKLPERAFAQDGA
ncbi:MAG: hypothetical protein V3S24_16570 [Candidatus Tectomicrobia bacterium]